MARRDRLRRGPRAAIHRLLQVLPDMPTEARVAAAHRYLRKGRSRLAGDRNGLPGPRSKRSSTRPISRLCSRRDRRPRSRSWAKWTCGAGKGLFSGKIDRLAVTADEVMIVDYRPTAWRQRHWRRFRRPMCSSLRSTAPCFQPLYPGQDDHSRAALHRGAAADRAAPRCCARRRPCPTHTGVTQTAA